MKSLIFLLAFIPMKLLSQDLPGVWKGYLYNDTTKQYLTYELAISEKKVDKYDAFSYTVFIIDGVENVGVKMLDMDVVEDHLELKDKKLIFDNYPVRPAKGVKTLISLRMSETDDSLVLAGPWHTNQTKEFVSIRGNIRVAKIKPQQSKLIVPTLVKLGYANDLSFLPHNYGVEPTGQVASANNVKPGEKPVDDKEMGNVAVTSPPASSRQLPKATTNNSAGNSDQTPGNVTNNTSVSQPATSAPNPVTTEASKKSISNSQPPEATNGAGVPVTGTRNNNQISPESSPVKKNDAAEQTTRQGTTNSVANVQSRDISSKEQKPAAIQVIPKITPAAKIAARKTETIRSVDIKQDSIILSLYDNGEIDGDTVSVVLNGKVIMPMQGLRANAINKTVYFTPEMGDSLTLVMYAENLGSIPPNTGLLVVRDGEDIYEIRFSGDYQKNSAIILRRKKSSVE